ncbi:MAG: WG repeat-containing protein, partial [Clostridia bacterium]|nr:WG repeat-containing protein [Clostridia bacterium]
MKRIVCAVCLLALLGALSCAFSESLKECLDPDCVFPSVRSAWKWGRKDGQWRLYNGDQQLSPVFDHVWTDEEMGYDGKTIDAPVILPQNCGDPEKSEVFVRYGTSENGVWGIADDRGRIMAEPQYEAIDGFYELYPDQNQRSSFCFVKSNGVWRACLPDGYLLLDVSWTDSEFRDDDHPDPPFKGFSVSMYYSAARKIINGEAKYSVIGYRGPRTPFQYDGIRLLSDCFFGRIGDRWKLCGYDGSVWTDFSWTDEDFRESEPITSFSGDYAALRGGSGGERKFGLIRNDGTLTVPCKYDAVYHDRDHFFGLLNGEWRAYRPDGSALSDIAWPDGEFLDDDGTALPFRSFNNSGFSAIRTGAAGQRKYGVLREDGTLVIPCVYEQIEVQEDCFFARSDGAWRLYDISGTQLAQKTWTEEEYAARKEKREKIFSGFYNEEAFHHFEDADPSAGDIGFLNVGGVGENRWGIIDRAGNWLTEPVFEDYEYCWDHVYFGKTDGHWMLYKTGRGEPMLKYQWNDDDFYGGECDDEAPLGHFDECGMSVIRFGSNENERYGVIDKEGSMIIQPIYSYMRYQYAGDLITAEKPNGQQCVLDRSGRVLRSYDASFDGEVWVNYDEEVGDGVYRIDEDRYDAWENDTSSYYTYQDGALIPVETVSADLDLTPYEPFTGERTPRLEEPSSLKLTGDALPRVDGATALFPLYSGVVEALYPDTVRYEPHDEDDWDMPWIE